MNNNYGIFFQTVPKHVFFNTYKKNIVIYCNLRLDLTQIFTFIAYFWKSGYFYSFKMSCANPKFQSLLVSVEINIFE